MYHRTLALLLSALVAGSAFADIVTAETLHVGGFLDGGFSDNSAGHQNYFVGYGSVGHTRSTERRSFFWYHLPAFSGEVVDVSIKLTMAASTSLIFGYDPSDPTGHDHIEDFQLGATMIPHETLIRSDLSSSEAQTIFDDFNDHPIAPAYEFTRDIMYDFPMVVDVHLSDFGKSLISMKRGMDFVFTGWMPTWSENDEMDGMGHYIEGDELLFGLSDVGLFVPKPELTIVFDPVPEPGTLAVLGVGAALLARRRIRPK